MKLTTEEVRHLAVLARVGMTDQEVERMRDQMSNILEHMDVLQQADTEGVEPTAHPLPIHTVLREDEIAPSYEPDKALQNAPHRDGSFFAVPKVLNQGESS